MSVRRHTLPIAAIGTLALLGCAATSPLTDANIGNEKPLLALVMSGQVKGDTMMPYYETSKSVFCALVTLPGAEAEAAISKTLQDGVDINKRCRPDAMDSRLPLDMVTDWIGYSNEPGQNYKPQNTKIFIARANQFLQRGAKSQFGPTDMTGVLKRAAQQTDAVVAQKEYGEELRRAEAQKKFFNLEALAAAMQIVGGAASNYAASRSGLPQYVPQGSPQTSPPSPNASSAGNAKTAAAKPSAQNPQNNLASAATPANSSARKSTEAPRFSCEATENFPVDADGRRTPEQACAEAEKRANVYAENLPTPTFLGPSSSRLKKIHACEIKTGRYSNRYAIVKVDYTYLSGTACDAPGTGIAK